MKKIIFDVREALEKDEIKECYIGFNAFPNGSCMDASILLGIILQDKGFGSFEVTSIDSIPSHSWLQNEELLIDITADQFDKSHPKVLITLKSKDEVHLGFKLDKLLPINKEHYPKDIGFVRAVSLVKMHLFSKEA